MKKKSKEYQLSTSGEPFDHVIATHDGLEILVPKSEFVFYQMLGEMYQFGYLSEFARLSSEYNIMVEGFKHID